VVQAVTVDDLTELLYRSEYQGLTRSRRSA
jgi:hypothetical protein